MVDLGFVPEGQSTSNNRTSSHSSLSNKEAAKRSSHADAGCRRAGASPPLASVQDSTTSSLVLLEHERRCEHYSNESRRKKKGRIKAPNKQWLLSSECRSASPLLKGRLKTEEDFSAAAAGGG